MSLSSKVYIGYNSKDFYYLDAMNRGAPYAPTDKKCLILKDKDIKCDHQSFVDTSLNCIQKEMCKNKELVDSLGIQHAYNGGQQKYDDYNEDYYYHLMRTLNLGVGICIIISLITLRLRSTKIALVS